MADDWRIDSARNHYRRSIKMRSYIYIWYIQIYIYIYIYSLIYLDVIHSCWQASKYPVLSLRFRGYIYLFRAISRQSSRYCKLIVYYLYIYTYIYMYIYIYIDVCICENAKEHLFFSKKADRVEIVPLYVFHCSRASFASRREHGRRLAKTI